MKKIFILMIITAATLTAFASDKAGSISEFSGQVLLYDGLTPRPAQVETAGTEIFIKNRVTTKRDSSALIDFISGDKVALTENSSLSVDGVEIYQADEGKVIFNIRKRGQTSGVRVATKTAVIGVKGTEFLVGTDENGKQNIYLKEGEIECSAKDGQFKKYLDVQIDEYEAYVRQMQGELDEYVKELQEQYVEFVESFVMKAGMAYSIDGNEVRKLEFTDDIMELFELVE